MLKIPKYGILSKYPTPVSKNAIKLQAVLVYAYDRLKDVLNRLEMEKLEFSSKEEEKLYKELFDEIYNLKETVRTQVPTYEELAFTLENTRPGKVAYFSKKEILALSRYYNYIAMYKFKDNNLVDSNEKWMPELFVLSLLNSWLIEVSGEKHCYKEVFDNFDFQGIIDNYNKLALLYKDTKEHESFLIINRMYDCAEELIVSLKNINYAEQTVKSKTKRKKRK